MLEQLMQELDEANAKADRLRATLRDAETILLRCNMINTAPSGKQIEAMQQYIHGALLKAETLNEAVVDIANYLQREFMSKKKIPLRDWIAYCKERGYINPKVADGVSKLLDEKEKSEDVAVCDPHVWDEGRLFSFWRQAHQKEKPPEGGSETPAFDAAIQLARTMFKAPD